MEAGNADVLVLEPERAGPYLRALQGGLAALAPHEDFPPLQECLSHLKALDPALSGDILLPAEVDARAGLPSFLWMERALAEQAVAREGGYSGVTDEEIAGAAALDRRLSARLAARRDLHRHLRSAALLPVSRLQVALKRVGRTTDFVLAFDRMTPAGAWTRTRVELSGPAGWERFGPVARTPEGGAIVDKGMQHLLSRHLLTPLLALRQQVEHATGASVPRLSRSTIGPFWFPGLKLPARVPEPLRGGLLLHLAAEVVAADVRRPGHRDPWLPAPAGETAPEGHGIYRERRFAASPNLIPAVQAWAGEQGLEAAVVPLVPGR